MILCACLFGISRPIGAQSTWPFAIFKQAQQLNFVGNYDGSLDLWLKAEEAYLKSGDLDSAILSKQYYLDALLKLSRYSEIKPELSNLYRQIDQLDDSRFDRYAALYRIKKFEIACNVAFNRLDHAKSANQQLIAELEPRRGEDDLTNQRLIGLYFTQAEILDKLGSYINAIEYNSKAINEIFEHGYMDTYLGDGAIFKALNQNADCFLALGDTMSLLREFDRMQDFLSQIESKVAERSHGVYARIFDFYASANQIDRAAFYLEKLKSLRIFEQDNLYRQARLDAMTFEPKQAIPRLTILASEIGRLKGESHSDHLMVLLLQSQLFIQNGSYQDAINLLEDVAQIESKLAIDNPKITLQLHQSLSQTYWAKYQDTQLQMDLNLSWQNIQQSIEEMKRLRLGYDVDSDRQYLLETSYQVFELALHIAYEKFQLDNGSTHWIDTAFLLMESSKSLSLIDATRQSDALANSGLPDTVLNRIVGLQAQISKKREDVFETQMQYSATSLRVSDLQSDLIDLEQSYLEELAQIEIDFPDYRRQMSEQEAISFASVRQFAIDRNLAVIELFQGPEYMYLIVTTGHKDDFIRVGKTRQISLHCQSMRSAIKAFGINPTRESIVKYRESAYSIYQMLFDGLNLELPEKLVVIPDGALRSIPFSALINSEPDENQPLYDVTFLMKDHVISYRYSMSLTDGLSHQSSSTPLSVLAFAPSFTEELSESFPDELALDPLPYNQLEVAGLKKKVRSNLFLGELATKQQLINEIAAKDVPGILHISSHGHADEDFGQLSFVRFHASRPDVPEAKLMARDLNAMRLPFQLVVLSACETATGQLKVGEGVLGLSRAFFHSGVRSVLTTLWTIADRSSSNIVIDFYASLKRGQETDVALRSAQLNYLNRMKTEGDEINAHPFYWSAFVPIGEMVSFEKSSPPKQIYWIGGLGLALIIGMGIWNKKR